MDTKNNELDQLINRALELCKKYDSISPHLFQRSLEIDLDTAEAIFDELERIGVVINARPQDDDPDSIIADVDKKKLHVLQTN